MEKEQVDLQSFSACSCVYKCVCKQFSERLYNDLLGYMSQHCDKLKAALVEQVGSLAVVLILS